MIAIDLFDPHLVRSIYLIISLGQLTVFIIVTDGAVFCGDLCLTRYIEPLLVQCWSTVYDAGPTLNDSMYRVCLEISI